jgi:pyruvate,water dikinase
VISLVLDFHFNNDYGEAVITSNFGIGESVVGGIVTPDEYIINKTNKNIISEKIGSKEKIVKLNKDKNETTIIEQSEEKQKESSLINEYILRILEAIIKIEKEYKIPIDIEFGIENNILYILQARPITTYNKLPEILLTKPNERRQLYFDGTLGVQGFEKPMSTLGSTLFKVFGHYMGIKLLGSYNFDNIKESAVDVIGEKLILNFSNILTKLSKETLINFSSNINRIISETLSKYSEVYKNDKTCYEIDVSILGMAWRLPIKRLIFYNYYAKSTKENFEYYLNEFMKNNEKYINENLNSNVPIITILEKICDELTSNIRDYIIPLIFLGMVKGYNQINKLFENYVKENPELNEDLNNLTKCFPFITIQMGLDLYKLSQYLDKNIYKNKTQEEFYQDFLLKKFPKEFYTDFDNFMKKYGFRGEWEFDIINERYSENHKTIINQIYSSLLFNDENNNPKKTFDDTNAKRPSIFKKLLEFAKENGFENEFEQGYNNMINYFQYRESPKYFIIFIIGNMRKLILKRANILLENKLIDDMNDIFKLNINSLNDILKNVNNYTKEKIYSQIEKDNKLNELICSWKRYPIIFDSRGRIFFQEKKISNKKNELVGDTVSFGKITGKAKVLNSVDEKPFNPGEILITKETDPGWTPLIINCGGIVLEVGGMLQHGALVSREFNKPCVVGIENVTKIIRDGENVEVDAIEGVVRLLDRKEESM